MKNIKNIKTFEQLNNESKHFPGISDKTSGSAKDIIDDLDNFMKLSYESKLLSRKISNKLQSLLQLSLDFLEAEDTYVDGKPITKIRDQFEYIEFKLNDNFRLDQNYAVMEFYDDIGSTLEIKLSKEDWDKYIIFMKSNP